MTQHDLPHLSCANARRQGGSLQILTAAALATLALLWAGLYASLVHSQHRQTKLAAQRMTLQSSHSQALTRVMDLWNDTNTHAWAQAGGSACAAHPMRAQMNIAWECMRVTAAEQTEGSALTLEVLAARDVLKAPQVAHISIRSQHDEGHSRLQERASLWTSDWGQPPSATPATPDPAQAAQLVLQGCQDIGGAPPPFSVFSLAIPDLDGNGVLSTDERIRCLAADLLEAPNPASSAEHLRGEFVADSAPGACVDRVWQRLFGSITPLQVQRLSQAQERAGLGQFTQPKRSMYWVDDSFDWTQDLGDANNPVVLVFSEAACQTRCPSIRSRIFGTVYFATQCQASRLQTWQIGHIQGLVGVGSGLPRWPSTSGMEALSQRENALNFPSQPLEAPSAARLVPGSRHWP